MADASHSKCDGATRAGSNPAPGTKIKRFHETSGHFDAPFPNMFATGTIFCKVASGRRLRQLSESLLS